MVTTINAYNVSLGMDASDYLRKSELSRGETRKLAQAIDEARTPAERYENAVSRLTSAKAAGAIQTGTFIRLMDEEKRKLDATSQSMKTHSDGMSDLTSRVKGLVASYVGLQTISKSVRLAIDAEQAAAQFEVMTGSLNDAMLLGSQVRSFAAVSPVSLGGAQNAAKMMLGYNVQVQDVQRNLKALGDISGGNEQKFHLLTYAFSQMTSAGRLMGGELRQMVEAGFNPLQEISRKTGESMIDLKKRMEDGGISVREATDAFISATSEGGRFHGMTEKMAETMGGKLTIATANLELALTNLGKALGPLIIQLTDGMDRGVSIIDNMTGAVGRFADGWGFLFAVVSDIGREGGQLADLLGYGDGTSLTNTNKFLDLLFKRDLENARTTPTTFLGKPEDIEKVKTISEDLLKKWQDAEDKEINKWLDALDKEDKKKMDMIRRHAETALQYAENLFKSEREQSKRLRDDIAKGPQSLEAGSAEAAKYVAEQANAAIAASLSLNDKIPTEEELLLEAQKQSEMMATSAENEAKQVELLRQLLEKKPDTAKIR